MNNDNNNQNGFTGSGGWDFAEKSSPTNQYNQGQGQNTSWQPPEGSKWDFESYATQGKGKNGKKNKGVAVFAGLLCTVLVCAMLGLSGYGLYSIISGNASGDENITNHQQPSEDENGLLVPQLNSKPSTVDEDVISADGKLTTQQVAKKTLPTVVGIVSYYGGGNMMANDYGEGSGIVITDDGYIVTNAHVVEGSTGIKVVAYNGDEYSAQIIGTDKRSDLAVLKVEAEGLPYAEFGNSDELEIGEPVIAVGNPGGLILAGSVTDGIVSALNRPISTSSAADVINCIQTNAAINPGNSGGALVNQYGQVVGINSSKIVYEGYEGLGFAIAINEAQPIIEDLMEFGMVTGRVKIGVSIQEVDEYLARLNNIPTGIFVQQVEPDSDAFRKGIVPGDVITHVNGTKVQTLAEVREIIDEYEAGDQVALTIHRSTTGYKAKTMEITIELMADTPTPAPQQDMQ